MGQAGLCCLHPAAPHDAPRATLAGGQQDHRDQGTQQPQCPWHHVPQRYPAFARLSPGVEISHLREGLRAGCPHGGQLAHPRPLRLCPGLWAVLRNPPSCPKTSVESPAWLSCVTCSPAANWQLLLSGHLETEIQQQKKNLTHAGKGPVPGSGKPRRDPLQQNHVLKRRKVWGGQMRGRGSPTGVEF